MILEGKKIIFLADSYDAYGGWINKTATRLGLAGTEYWNLGLSGSSFTDGRWQTQLSTWVANHPNDIADVGYIVCGGGINDSSPYQFPYLGGAMTAFSNYAKGVFGADVKIKLAYFGWALDTSIILCDRTAHWRRQAMTMYSKATDFGMEYLCGCESALHDRTVLDADGLHPNAEGGNRIAEAVSNALLTGCATITNTGNATIVANGGVVNGLITQTIFGGQNSIYFNDFGISGCSFRFQSGAYVPIATIKLPYGNKIPIQMTQVLMHPNNGMGSKLFNCRFKIENDVLYFSLYDVNPATQMLWDLTIDNISQFCLSISTCSIMD